MTDRCPRSIVGRRIDTSGLIAVVNADDQWHAAAEAVWQELIWSNASLVTTSPVLDELGDELSQIEQRRLALETVKCTLSGSNMCPT